MEWLSQVFGGVVCDERRNNPKHKRVWRWYASASDLDRLLVAVMPYLVLKRDRAELMLAYRQTLHQVGNPRRTSDEMKRKRMDIHSELSILNQRGLAI
jgi:hypothetical protein